jgi:YesN/AraC family two-component response regulator
VLTDINMPGADGFDVLRAARKANAAADVVVISGYASRDSAQRAFGLGAHQYLPKPFKLGQIDTILSGIGARRALAHSVVSQQPAAAVALSL